MAALDVPVCARAGHGSGGPDGAERVGRAPSSDLSKARHIVQRMAKQMPCSKGPPSHGLSGHKSYCAGGGGGAVRGTAAQEERTCSLTHSFVVTPLHTRQQWHAASTSMKRLNKQP